MPGRLSARTGERTARPTSSRCRSSRSGARRRSAIDALQAAGDYSESYFLHGFSVQSAEALAEYTHRRDSARARARRRARQALLVGLRRVSGSRAARDRVALCSMPAEHRRDARRRRFKSSPSNRPPRSSSTIRRPRTSTRPRRGSSPPPNGDGLSVAGRGALWAYRLKP